MCVLVMNIILNIIVIWALKKVNFGKTGGIAMGKKIVVITGSPRKNGNSLAMTKAFIEAAEARGHSVTRFDAVSLNVGGVPCL